MGLSGKLVYGQSNVIYSLDLSTLKDRIVYQEGEGLSIFSHATKIDDRYLLFEVYTQDIIKKLDLKTSDLMKVRSGARPKYISEHKKLFYFDRLPDKSQGGLFVADISEPIGSARLVHEGPFFIPRQVIQISSDEVMFQRREEEIFKYNIVTGVVSEQPIKNCTWLEMMRTATNQMLCFEAATKRFFLSDVKGGKSEYVPGLDGSSAAALYIPEYDVLVFSKARLQLFPPMGEVNDVWVYSFKEGKQTRLKKNATIGLGAAVWIK